MRRILLGLTIVTMLGFLGSTAHAGCNDPRAADLRELIASQCPCTGNHGQYVSCFNRHVREAVRNGELDRNCKGTITRCAARSTCGKKEGFVTCTICSPGTCSAGVCDDGVTACADSSECPGVVDRCSTKSSAERCEARGGIPGTGSCCDAVCVVGPSTTSTTSAPTTTTPPTTSTPTTSAPTTSTPTTTSPPTTTTTTPGSPSGGFVD